MTGYFVSVRLCGDGTANAGGLPACAGVTRFPTDEWTAQQLREATAWGRGPKYLIRDRDKKYGTHFSAVAVGSGIKELKTPYRTPQANGMCERFMGSLRRECLDHTLIHHGQHLQRVVNEYVTYFNQERPHQGIDQRIPDHYDLPCTNPTSGRIRRRRSLVGCTIVIPARQSELALELKVWKDTAGSIIRIILRCKERADERRKPSLKG